MEQRNVGFAACGSFCTVGRALEIMERLAERYSNLYPIASETLAATDTRFGTAKDFLGRMEHISGRPVMTTVAQAEPIGPKKLLDVLVICPCTGNTVGKLANGITDTAVTMAAKAHLRNGKPVVIAMATNDGLSGAIRNVGALLGRKNYYFVPFGQDDPVGKPSSLIANFDLVGETVAMALEGRQIQPILLGHK